MNTKTQMQIAEMKKTSFGVEIEMCNITRATAANTIAIFFGTTAEHQGDYYDTWTVEDKKGRTWKFMSDSSIDDTPTKRCEMVTPILYYEDIETLQEVVRQLRHKKALSVPSRGCGLHIHCGSNNHTPQTIRNLVNIMAGHEQLIAKAIQINRSRMNQYCKISDPDFVKRINAKKPKTMDEVKYLWYNGRDGSYQRYDQSRYRMLNLHALFSNHHTLEFRMFEFSEPDENKQGGLHAGQLKSYIQLCFALTTMSKMVKTSSPKEQQHDNEKFALRTYLNRLGMIGEEFKTARELFTRNLDGSSAWRFRA